MSATLKITKNGKRKDDFNWTDKNITFARKFKKFIVKMEAE